MVGRFFLKLRNDDLLRDVRHHFQNRRELRGHLVGQTYAKNEGLDLKLVINKLLMSNSLVRNLSNSHLTRKVKFTNMILQ